jgi:hypothetical protein
VALKRKKGSSLITIIVVFGVLATFGIATLSLVAADYKMRIVASKKTQSLYYSDSGINVVNAAIKKIVEQAVDKGNEAASTFLNSDLSIFTKEDGKNEFLNSDGSINKPAVDAKLKVLFKEEYKKSITDYLNNADNKAKLENGIYLDASHVEHNLYDVSLTSKPTITINYGDSVTDLAAPAAFTLDKELLNIKVASSFEVAALSGETSNLKKISAKLTIAAAEYNRVYGVTSKAVTIEKNPIWENSISVDGNLKLKNSVEFHGDVFVKGILPEEIKNTEKVYTKYNGGITLGEDDALSSSELEKNKILFAGDIITGGSFNISGQNRLVEVVGNLFARNVYIGKSLPTSQNAQNCQLKVSPKAGSEAKSGAVYTVNDLSLNALASKISLDKYYGINDINMTKNFRAGLDADYNSSSSIIINTEDIGKPGGSSLEVNEEAVIMGSAYVNTNPAYQTGESVAIKGNYMAYTQAIPASGITDSINNNVVDSAYTPYEEKNITPFEYYDPLMLASTRNDKAKNENALTIDDKAKYIELVDILKLMPGGNGINKSGIKLPTGEKLITSGIALSDNKLVRSNFGGVHEDKIYNLKTYFAGKVYNEIGVKDHNLEDVYYLGKLNRTVFEGVPAPDYGTDNTIKNPVSQVLLNDSNYNRNSRENNMLQFISNNEDAIILGKNWDKTYTGSLSNVIYTNDLPIKGIIITKKNVKVYGEVDFTGTIIAGGDFIAEDGYKKVFRTNTTFMQSLIATYYESVYKNIFNNVFSAGTQEITISNSASSNTAVTGEAFQSDLVRLSNWRIDK